MFFSQPFIILAHILKKSPSKYVIFTYGYVHTVLTISQLEAKRSVIFFYSCLLLNYKP